MGFHVSGMHHFILFLQLFYKMSPNVLLGEGNGTPLQYSCLENPMDRGAWWAAVHGVEKHWAQLSMSTDTSVETS